MVVGEGLVPGREGSQDVSVGILGQSPDGPLGVHSPTQPVPPAP